MLERKGVVTRKKYSLDSDFEKLLNYSRVVDDGEWVFISGCSGFDYTDMTIAESMTEQTQQVFSNIDWCLSQANVDKNDVVRIRVIIADKGGYMDAAKVIGEWCEACKPSNTTWFAELPDPRIKVEIEVTARRSQHNKAPDRVVTH
jgi:enamine deaminase RidA (YjgF/YER057c/UK114 family)